ARGPKRPRVVTFLIVGNPLRASSLAEEYLPGLLVRADIDFDRCLRSETADDGRARGDCVMPALDLRKLRDVDAPAVPVPHPTEERDVGNRVVVDNEVPATQAAVEDAEKAMCLVAEASNGVRQLRFGVTVEVVVVAEDWTDIRDLPDETFFDGDPGALL